MSQGDGAPIGHPVIGAGLGAHAARTRCCPPEVGQLGAAQVDLAVCHHAETKLGPSMWSMLKGLLGEAAGEVG